jgi:hypothetical protein
VLDVDLTYAHSYEVQEFREIPGAGALDVPLVYLPKPKGRPEHDGLWVRFHGASGKCWVGVFAFGYGSPPAFSRVVSSPNPGRACVIANGRGFLVSADDYEQWEEIQIHPVLDVRAIPERQILVFADFTRLAAYGSHGLVWRSPQVCWDELKIVNVEHDKIEGTGYDPTNLCESKFVVDIRTGRSLLPAPRSIDGRPLW